MPDIIPTELIIGLVSKVLQPICDNANAIVSSVQKQNEIKKILQMLIATLLSDYDGVSQLYIERDIANTKVNIASLKSILVLIETYLNQAN